MRVWTPEQNYEIILTFADKKWQWRETQSLRSLKWDPSNKRKMEGKLKTTNLAAIWKKEMAANLKNKFGGKLK